MRTRCICAALAVLLAVSCGVRQKADTSYDPTVDRSTYERGGGPVVLIDEAHHNFHTAGGRYGPFAELLRNDGYVVRPSRAAFGARSLAGARILVISNALNERNVKDWSLPTPSAFTTGEIESVVAWVRGGGSLWLIADHMPFPGAAEELAQAFGLEFNNGFVFDREQENLDIVFRAADDSLGQHPIVAGRDATESVDTVRTFGGQAFRSGGEPINGFAPLFVLWDVHVSLMPRVAWEFDEQTTAEVDVAGWFQGATLRIGEGRVAVFGEAAMFTAQVGGPDAKPMGMNAPGAEQNRRFALNVAHWLSGLLDE